uniref:Uncharacterized protein n=1 Tax=Arundo donax TaxID=35708 RepID=A0A0A9GXL5_ARUDO
MVAVSCCVIVIFYQFHMHVFWLGLYYSVHIMHESEIAGIASHIRSRIPPAKAAQLRDKIGSYHILLQFCIIGYL